MKKLITIIISLQCLLESSAQPPRLQQMADSLQYLQSDSLDCNASLFWRIVAQGDKAIPFLIEKLDDTTLTVIAHICKPTKLNVGEVAYFALQQIAFFPAFIITHIEFDLIYGNGCWSFYDYFFNNNNKKHYQELLKEWYKNNKKKYKVQKIQLKDLSPCQKQFHIDKYYMWSE